MILDSGNRTDFGGAQRDIQKGKGRMDLLPLDVIGDYFAFRNMGCRDKVVDQMHRFMEDHNVNRLYSIIEHFCLFNDWKVEDMLLELSIHFEEGAEKYGERNYQQGDGIPVYSYINSALRHYFKHKRGDKDERHDRAFVWNVTCLAWQIKNKGEKLNE